MYSEILKELLEKKEKVHDYGCAMLYYKKDPSILKIQDSINPEMLYEDPNDDSYGMEEEPHTTLLYGLHEGVTSDEIEKGVEGFVFNDCMAYNLSTFDSEKYDVLKFDVEGADLKPCNKKLSELPHTSTFPDYHPHLTVAYLKKGNADKLVSKLKGLKIKLTPEKIVYSKTDGTEDTIKLKQ